MNCVGFEEIYRRPELIILIYQQLSFQDQLRLAGVNTELKECFKNFIHSPDYEVLNITKILPDKVLLTNKSDTNCMVLTTQEFKDFANIYTDDVMEFSYSHKVRKEIPDVSIEPTFHHLTCLHYEQMLVPDEHMKMIALQCPQLKELHLIMCFSPESNNREYLQIGKDLKITTLEQMRNLQTLTVEAEYADQNIEYGVVCELMTKVNLMAFNTKAYIVPDNSDKECLLVFKGIPHQLRELKCNLLSELWKDQFLAFLKTFENLVKLTIYMTGDIDDLFLETLAKACPKLESLSVAGRGDFTNIVNFQLPPNLKEFSLYNCYGITHENVRQILTEFSLEKFTTHYVPLEGEFKDFVISPYIRVLDVEQIGSYKFRSAFINNLNLKELVWHENRQQDYDEVGECPDPGPLETCLNLETLDMSAGWLPVQLILQLPHLKNLKISQDMVYLSWDYIKAVLKHPSLHVLNIHTWIDTEFENKLLESPDIPCKGFCTNLKVLHLPMLLFKRGLNFWLDLLNQNPDMKIICESFYVEYKFLQLLVENNNFPKDLKRILVWGFSLSCKDLRKDFGNAITKLDPIINILNLNSEHFHRLGRLVLSRET